MGLSKKIVNILTVCILALVAIPLLTFSTKKWSDPVEKRSSVDFPPLPHRLHHIAEFRAGLEAYFNDHFGFRHALIALRTEIDYVLFRHSSSPNVLIGRDNWLFFTGGYSIEDFEGRKKLTDQELERWYQVLKERREWLASQGIKYYFVFAPNKQSIYPEKMPAYISRGESTQIDQLKAYLTARGQGDMLLDLRSQLIAKKGDLPLYHVIDVHWNEYGGYWGYRAIMNRIVDQDHVEGTHVLDLHKSDFEPFPMRMGDMAAMLGFSEFPYMTYSTRYAGAPIACAQHEGVAPVEGLIKPESEFVTNCGEPGRSARLLYFRDSMTIAMENYFANSFSHVRFIWQYPTTDYIKRYTEIEKPSVVIEERVERDIYAPPP